MIKFDDGTHCHWTYRLYQYRSFMMWPTREAVEEHVRGNARRTGDEEIFQVHADFCECPK